MENPPKKFFRLSPGAEVRLRYAYFVTCREVVKNAKGEVTELRCSYDPATRGGNAPDGRKVKATIHWVSAAHSVSAEVRIYNPLFMQPDPGGENFTADLNPNSLEALVGSRLEPALADATSNNPCSSSGRVISVLTGTQSRACSCLVVRSDCAILGQRRKPQGNRPHHWPQLIGELQWGRL